jgi:hypothetical protein
LSGVHVLSHNSVQNVSSVAPSLPAFPHILLSGHRNTVTITSIERRVTVLTRRAKNGVPSIQLSSGDTVLARELAAVIS